MRENKYRYLVVRSRNVRASTREVEERVKNYVLLLFGVSGLSRTLPKVVYATGNGVFVLRVKREGVKLLRASLLLDAECSFIVVKTTGTSRKAMRIAVSIPPVKQ
ncbi:Rpp14/Pop5 family protein [Infirmifilum sp. NZ]|uniref:Rpp14/Pop5 family protein n=1 Tax=Infirmifilum sp. NZ TaxID=2926850 RepID=UPI0027AABC2A|nr:Rpp14/Pop5 family protein [Infirmifilum sp. NZ]UNQ74333.1 Rpp14/Pop5 family protein [Infirmifilum sp. NZ]